MANLQDETLDRWERFEAGVNGVSSFKGVTQVHNGFNTGLSQTVINWVES